MEYSFEQVDVFTTRRFAGNPLAVFTDAKGLSHDDMQHIAREMNLSETTFVVPSERADCVARYFIFTPDKEMPFAGHPTVGTAYVLARRGLVPNGSRVLNLEAAVGKVPVQINGTRDNPDSLFFTSPKVEFGPLCDDRAGIAAALGVAPSDLLAGAPVQEAGCPVKYAYVGLGSRAAVDAVDVTQRRFVDTLGDPQVDGAYVFALDARMRTAYSRFLVFTGGTVWEDSATGSAASPLGAYLVRHRLLEGSAPYEFVIEQGTKMGRQSFLTVRISSDDAGAQKIEVGGSAVFVLSGLLTM